MTERVATTLRVCRLPLLLVFQFLSFCFSFLVFFYRRGSLSTIRTGRWMRRRTACGTCTISYSSPGRRQGERRGRTSCAVAVLTSFADSRSKATCFFARRIRKTRWICKTNIPKWIRETDYHSGCLTWLACLRPLSYSSFTTNNRSVFVHCAD